jgi:hypothetical protein
MRRSKAIGIDKEEEEEEEEEEAKSHAAISSYRTKLIELLKRCGVTVDVLKTAEIKQLAKKE